MSESSESILDHIAEMLRFISNTQSLWFTLDMSYDHGCHLASRFRLERFSSSPAWHHIQDLASQ
jgi:hypothetical protein